MIGVEGDPNDTELFPLANFNPVCQVDVVRTDVDGKATEYKEPEVPPEPPIEVITALPEVEVIQKKDPPPVPPAPPVTEAAAGATPEVVPSTVDIGEPPPPNPDPALGSTGQLKLKESTVTFDSQDISAMERTETVSKSQQGSPVAPPRIKGRAARPSQKIRKPEILGEVVKPVEGMSGWGDGAATMGWGTHDEETPTQSNVGESEQPSQVSPLSEINSNLSV